MHTKTANIAKLNNGQIALYIPKYETIIDRYTENTGTLHTLHGSYSNPDLASDGSGCACDPCTIAKRSRNPSMRSPIADSGHISQNYLYKPDYKAVQSYTNMQRTTGNRITPRTDGIFFGTATNQRQFDGTISGLKTYGRTLTDDEISAHAATGHP
ncbi:hypothetical protein L0665_09060 [Methanogenium marinum]|uniref:Uncharacterized protein n=1 Tax=Methanogenium marinum TaxID=348610 RepID=A0A9Q4PWK9_9EURY|nr:hypothetical protein [Methanogenium marinum]MDE4908754.1 hypothetical protein [Methanogenium marinum]